MKILLLEDKGVVAYPLKESLEGENHKVLLAPNISRAKTYWRAEKEKLGCIIADLNMDPEGLKQDEKEQTENGLLTGWIWLRNYVFSQAEQMKKRTIILTAYMKELVEIVGEEQLEGIKLVEKNPLADGASGSVLYNVRNISKELEGEASEKSGEE